MGRVERITDLGASIEVMPGVDGLLHVSEMANYRVANVRDELKEGENIEVKVININPSGRIVRITWVCPKHDAPYPTLGQSTWDFPYRTSTCCSMTTSVDPEPRESASCLPSNDHAMLKIESDVNVVS